MATVKHCNVQFTTELAYVVEMTPDADGFFWNPLEECLL
jgi:hypothetical protein